jgi:hypothetical protein
VALGSEIVDLVRLGFLDDPNQVRRIGEITIMHGESRMDVLRLGINSVDALGIELRRASFDAVHHVPFCEEKPGEVGTILPRDTGNERSLHLFGF